LKASMKSELDVHAANASAPPTIAATRYIIIPTRPLERATAVARQPSRYG
jgi:hypothetical protein